MALRRSSKPGVSITPRTPQAAGAGTAGPAESCVRQQSGAPSSRLPLPDHLPHGTGFGPGHPVTWAVFFPRAGGGDPSALVARSHVLSRQAAWRPEVTRRHAFPVKTKPGAVCCTRTGGKEGTRSRWEEGQAHISERLLQGQLKESGTEGTEAHTMEPEPEPPCGARSPSFAPWGQIRGIERWAGAPPAG